MRFSYIVLLFAVAQATKKEIKGSNIVRKFFWPFDSQQPQNTYKPPEQLNYPILARITPINEANLQISDSFQAYIYPKFISPLYFPYYAALCRKPTAKIYDKTLDDSNKDSKQEAQEIDKQQDPTQKVFVENFNEIDKDFESQLKNKKEGLKDFNINSFEDIKQLNATQVVPMNVKMKELTDKMKDLSTIFVNKEIESSSESKNIQDSEKSSTLSLEDLKEKTKETSPNINQQSNVFQCEGVTCPEEAESCKVSEYAIEPDYEEILKTVYCLSKNGKTLSKKQQTFKNPNIGSSLSLSRTHSKNDELKMAEQMEDEFNQAIESFKTKISKKFGR